MPSELNEFVLTLAAFAAVGFVVVVVLVPMSGKAAAMFAALGGGAVTVIAVLTILGPKNDADFGLGLFLIMVLPILGIGLGGGTRVLVQRRWCALYALTPSSSTQISPGPAPSAAWVISTHL